MHRQNLWPAVRLNDFLQLESKLTSCQACSKKTLKEKEIVLLQSYCHVTAQHTLQMCDLNAPGGGSLLEEDQLSPYEIHAFGSKILP